jgi:murein DD-endopeptidase MepM/ murein hydrolase activator NlpD
MAREILQNQDSQAKHDALHHGYELEVPISAEPYLTLPFSQQELTSWIRHIHDPRFNRRRLYNISEGTIYSRDEQAIHGKVVHAAVDYDVPYGTSVVAPTSGYVVSSYESFWLTKGDKKVSWKGKPIAMGLGYVVQLYDPKSNRFLQF